jgi:hypothetical protein
MNPKDREWLEKRFDRIEIAIAKLQVKSGIWGMIGGAIPVAIIVVCYLLEKL